LDFLNSCFLFSLKNQNNNPNYRKARYLALTRRFFVRQSKYPLPIIARPLKNPTAAGGMVLPEPFKFMPIVACSWFDGKLFVVVIIDDSVMMKDVMGRAVTTTVCATSVTVTVALGLCSPGVGVSSGEEVGWVVIMTVVLMRAVVEVMGDLGRDDIENVNRCEAGTVDPVVFV
jgi:hypothetical protein